MMNRALVKTALWIATFGTLATAVFIANGFTAMAAPLATLATRWMYRRRSKWTKSNLNLNLARSAATNARRSA